MYKDANAFKNMFNKVPYSVVPPAIGVGLNLGENKKTGGYRSNSPRQMLYNNRFTIEKRNLIEVLRLVVNLREMKHYRKLNKYATHI